MFLVVTALSCDQEHQVTNTSASVFCRWCLCDCPVIFPSILLRSASGSIPSYVLSTTQDMVPVLVSLSISLSSPWHKVGVYVLRLWQPLFPLAAVFNTSPGLGGAFSYLFSSVVFYSSSTSLVSQISQYMYVLSMILLDLLYIFFFSTLAGCNDHTSCLLPWPYLHIARASC